MASRVVFTAFVILTGFTANATAADFEPTKYFKDPALLSAISSAAISLINCDKDLIYSETGSIKDGTQMLTLTITCPAWELDDGKIGKATAQVIFENVDGTLWPVEFGYDIP